MFTSWLRLQGSDQVSTLRGYNDDPNRFTQLRISNHTTYVALNPCICQLFPQILHNVNWSALPGSTVLLHPASSQEGTRYSHHLPRPVRGCLFTYGIDGFRLTHDEVCGQIKGPRSAGQQSVRSLIDTDGRPFLLSVWSHFKLFQNFGAWQRGHAWIMNLSTSWCLHYPKPIFFFKNMSHR